MSYGSYGGGNSFWSSIPPVTRNIITINIIVFVATLLRQSFMIEKFSMFYPTSPFFHIWQPVTMMFMHGGFWHIFFNMYTLFLFGTVVERVIGSKKFLVFYFVTGLGAVAVHTGVQHLQILHYLNLADGGSISAMQSYYDVMRTPTLGASGAIYGVLIGYAMLYPNSVLTLLFPPISLKAKWFVLIFAGIEVVTGIFMTSDGVAHFAHLGGMIFGFLLLRWWMKRHRLYDRDNWF